VEIIQLKRFDESSAGVMPGKTSEKHPKSTTPPFTLVMAAENVTIRQLKAHRNQGIRTD